MSKEIVKNGTYELDESKIQVLTQAGVIPAGTPPAQVKLFAEVCKTKGLSPFSKEIYLLGYKDGQTQQMKYSIITGIDGYRKIAARTGQLAGCSNPIFDLKSNGQFKSAAEVAESGQDPISCTITVMRLIAGVAREFTATVLFKEFNGKKQKWLTMPVQMISKVAEAFALRKGFDDELSGIGIEEEAAAYESGSGRTVVEKEIQELTPKHPKWNEAVLFLRNETGTIEQIRKKYTLSEENKEILLSHVLEAV